MFKIIEDQSYWWPVTVEYPSDGAFARQTFKACFRVIAFSDLQRLQAGSPVEVIREALIDWKDIVDDERQPVPFSDETASQLLENPFAVAALSRALANSVQGRREKN